jgi:hypothetical protein
MPLKSRIKFHLILVLLFSLAVYPILSQDRGITGRVTDTAGVALPYVNVYIPESGGGTSSSTDGQFTIPLPADKQRFTIIFSLIGYKPDTLLLNNYDADLKLNVTLFSDTIELPGVEVKSARADNITAISVPVVAGMVIPSVTGGIEAVITTLPGVASFSELSSSYSVRGGSYDENLVYINDVEVYRPYLIRSGQQEGLSRINPDLTSSVIFSPGVLVPHTVTACHQCLISDTEPEALEALSPAPPRQRTPEPGAGTVNSISLQDKIRTNALMLNSLDVSGQYEPRFTDIQAMAGYKPGTKTQITLSLWGSSNRYTFIPQSQTTTFGTTAEAFKLFAWFEGGERDRYDNGGGAVTLDIRHNDNLSSKFILSGYLASENENFDIRGAYSLTALDKTEGSETLSL